MFFTFIMDTEKRRIWINNYRTKCRRKLKKIVNAYKKEKGCSCGYNKCASALVFHHKDKNKEEKIARLVGSGAGLNRIMREIKKCEVKCANCHNEFHYPDDD